MKVNLEGISVFVEAAESHSFSKAAERLALTRSAVGKTIARLESRLGVRLFHRTTRSQRLTEQGQIYYERCIRAISELSTGESLLESGRKEVSGKLSVTMPLLFGRYCAVPVLLNLAQQYPALELELSFSDRIVDLMNENYDLAIRFDSGVASGPLQSVKIASQRKVICASPDYLSEKGIPKTLHDLISHNALVYRTRGQIQAWRFCDKDGNYSEPELRSRLSFDSLEVIADAAVKGMGLANLPMWLIHELVSDGKLITQFDHLSTPYYDTYAVWPPTQYTPIKLQVVIDALVSELRWINEA